MLHVRPTLTFQTSSQVKPSCSNLVRHCSWTESEIFSSSSFLSPLRVIFTGCSLWVAGAIRLISPYHRKGSKIIAYDTLLWRFDIYRFVLCSIHKGVLSFQPSGWHCFRFPLAIILVNNV